MMSKNDHIFYLQHISAESMRAEIAILNKLISRLQIKKAIQNKAIKLILKRINNLIVVCS